MTEPERNVGGHDVAGAVDAAWRAQLDRDTVADDENFFDVGGNSLEGAELMAALSRVLGHRLRLALLINNPTPARLTAAVAHALANGLAPALRRRVERDA
jgi:phosphopantetheine binding protein